MYIFLTSMYTWEDSTVNIATRYGLEGLWIESQWGVIFSAPIQVSPGLNPASHTMGSG
jgi:hypothetical protein